MMNYYTIDQYNTLTPTVIIKMPGLKLAEQSSIYTSEQLLPKKEGYGWRLVNGAPVQLKDNRGKIYSTATGKEIDFQELGDIPEGYTDQMPEAGQVWDGQQWIQSADQLLNDAYNKKLTDINQAFSERNNSFYSTVTGKNYRYSIDSEAQLNLTGLVLANVDSPYICYDGDKRLYVNHSAEQLKTLGLQITAYKAEIIGIQADLLTKLTDFKAAKNRKAIEALTWPN